jgi:predicted ATPase
MLEKLRIQNFKGWKDTGEIRMAPMTLFFGTNSSGKSSIGQFLMMLKQTTESADRKTVFHSGSKNSAVQLGSFPEMVYGRDKNTPILFEYQWSLPKKLKILGPIARKEFQGNRMKFSAKVNLSGRNAHSPRVDFMEYVFVTDSDGSISVKMESKKAMEMEYAISAQNYSLIRNQGRVWPLPQPTRFYGFPDEVPGYHQNADFVKDFNLVHEQLFQSISYLGPLRNKTERLYSWPGNSPENVGVAGENTIPALLASRGREIQLAKGRRSQEFQVIIAQELKKLGLIDSFEVRQIDKRQDYEVKVHTRGAASHVDLPDVGFGISQVLPVLVQCFHAPENSIIIMEQPEIHLHPSAQSNLADVMIDVMTSREKNKNRNIQLIIETHSEHFLRRLQRRIAEEKISRDSMAAYFADTTSSTAQLNELEIDEYGHIRNWPENFFGDEMSDMLAQAESALTRKRKKSVTQ